MKLHFFIFGVLVWLAIVWLMFRRKQADFDWGLNLKTEPKIDFPYYAKKALSAPEQVLYFRLLRALPNHVILAQVQVSRVLGVKKGSYFHEWNNRINRLSYDFVVCNKDFSVLAAIELDDGSHETEERKLTDLKKDKATLAAGIQMIRWHVNDLPTEVSISERVRALQGSLKETVVEDDFKLRITKDSL